MDANKAQTLRDIGYQIFPVCGSCVYGQFAEGVKWGICGLHTYDHKKHTESRRPLSININGGCSSHELDKVAEAKYYAFGEFVK